MIPRKRQRDREADDEREHEGAPHGVGPMERVTYEFGAVRECKRRSEVADAPLDDFVLLDSLPKTIGGVEVRHRHRRGLIWPCLASHRLAPDAHHPAREDGRLKRPGREGC